MALEKTAEVHPEASEDEIVDADFHIEITSQEPIVEYISDDVIREKVQKWGLPNPMYSGWKSSYAHDKHSGATTQGTAVTQEEIGEVMQNLALDQVIATPGGFGISLNDSRYITLKTELAKAYNSFITHEVLNPDKGIFGTFLLPEWDTEAAIDEIERMRNKDGIVAAQSYFGPHEHVTGRGTTRDPIFETLVAAGLPLCLHVGGLDTRYTERNATRESYVETIAVAIPDNAMSTIANMIMTGLFDKFPELHIVMQEGGTNWIPFLANRLDEIYMDHPHDVKMIQRKHEMGDEYLDRSPSEYIWDNFSFTTQPTALPGAPDYAKAMLGMCRAQQTFLFSTDFPHHTIDVADWVYDNPGIDDELRTNILQSNAEALFDLTA